MSLAYQHSKVSFFFLSHMVSHPMDCTVSSLYCRMSNKGPPVLETIIMSIWEMGNAYMGNVWWPSFFYHIGLHTALNILVEEQSWGKFCPICRETWCSGDSSGGDVSKQDNEEMLLWGPGGVQVGTFGAGFQQDQLSHGADPLSWDPAHAKSSS